MWKTHKSLVTYVYSNTFSLCSECGIVLKTPNLLHQAYF